MFVYNKVDKPAQPKYKYKYKYWDNDENVDWLKAREEGQGPIWQILCFTISNLPEDWSQMMKSSEDDEDRMSDLPIKDENMKRRWKDEKKGSEDDEDRTSDLPIKELPTTMQISRNSTWSCN